MEDFLFGVSLFISFFVSLATLFLARSMLGFFLVCLPIAVGFFFLVIFAAFWADTALGSVIVMILGIMGIMIAENWDLFEKKR